MKIAVMQPYFFPYLGYFQLCRAVDRFVIYDDVNYIKQGWINRNRICVSGSPWVFTVPLESQSSFSKINETKIAYRQKWGDKLLKTIDQAYRKTPHFGETFPLLEEVIRSPATTISELACRSIIRVARHLDLATSFIESSTIYGNEALAGEARVLDICKKEGAQEYLNLSGGIELYSKAAFESQNISLNFIRMKNISYSQASPSFIGGLSIIDVLMHNSVTQTKSLLNEFELV